MKIRDVGEKEIESDRNKIRNIIENSKLYQGFQCGDYVIRWGLKEQLVEALAKANIIKEK